jgi:tetratricopeptide (TPR) repeat protein
MMYREKETSPVLTFGFHKYSSFAIFEHKMAATNSRVYCCSTTATTLNNLANLYKVQEKYEQAESLFKRALIIREKLLGEGHINTATTLNNLAVLYYNQGKYERAEPLFKRALATRERVLGEEHADTTTTRNNLADLLRKTRREDEAAQLGTRAQLLQSKPS